MDAGADYIFQTDSDGQTLPDEFWQFWKKRKTCGLLIGYRKKEKMVFPGFCDKSAETGTVSDLWDMGKDANTPYRLMNAKQLSKVLKKIPDGFSFNVLMTVIYEASSACGVYTDYIPSASGR